MKNGTMISFSPLILWVPSFRDKYCNIYKWYVFVWGICFSSHSPDWSPKSTNRVGFSKAPLLSCRLADPRVNDPSEIKDQTGTTVYFITSPSWITAFLWQRGLHNSVKLWAMPCRATQDGWVIVNTSNKMWSTGGGNGNPIQNSCHKNSMNIMKRQKDMTLEDDTPSLVLCSAGHIDQPWHNIERDIQRVNARRWRLLQDILEDINEVTQ